MADIKTEMMMDHPFPKSTSYAEKLKCLEEVVRPRDTLGILIDADPDSMASALALKRLLWRQVKHVFIYRINRIKRSDNLAFITLLKVEQQHIRYVKRPGITKWAVVDAQPQHREKFMGYEFDIIIDHHPVLPTSRAHFVDIREDYGATATIMTEYLRAAKVTPSPRLPTALFYGIKTDTANFVRQSLPNDLNAFRYLHNFVNMNIIRKIESSEMTRKTLSQFRLAIDRLTLLDGVAYVHMNKVDNPDILVIIADFLMKLAEARWSIVSGIYDKKLVIILRNASFRGNAGKTAKKLFDQRGGSAGGHASAARAEVPLEAISEEMKNRTDLRGFVLKNLKEL
jgi:nanoRNase/pAp phosphatase (c-di-AMP/oligoRNAs hydrolase)